MRYLFFLLLLWPTLVGAQDYGQTIDTNQNPATGNELFVGGDQAIGRRLDVGQGPGIDLGALPGGIVNIHTSTGTKLCAGGPNDGVVCNTDSACPDGFCFIEPGTLFVGTIVVQDATGSPIEVFQGVHAYSISGSSDLTETICTETAFRYLYYSIPENRWKKCSAGVLTDLDTTDTGLFDTCSELSLILDPGSNGDQTSGFCGKVVLSEYPTLNYPIVTGGLFMLQEPSIHPSDCVSNLYDIYVDDTGTWKKCMNGALTNLDTTDTTTFDSCTELRALVGGTGACGNVVYSEYPTIQSPTIVDQLNMISTDIFSAVDCTAGHSFVYVDTSENKWKKCTNGTLTDLDVALPTPTSTTNPTATATPTPTATVSPTPVTCTTESSGLFGGVYTLRPDACRALPAAITYTGAVALGPGPTATAAATPTATAATPTATGVTPTPTPTASPPIRLLGAVEIEGDLTFSPATSRTVQVGACKVPPCTGVALTLLGGNANSASGATGGAISLQGGTATGLNNGGAASLIAGLGGGNAIVTARLGFLNTGGELYLDGNVVSRVAAGGNAPTIGTCGTTPAIVGTNNAFRATIGTGGTATACTITFADGGFVNAPICTANYDTAPDGVLRTQTSTTAVIITNYDDTLAGTWVAGAYPASAVLNVLCVGRE